MANKTGEESLRISPCSLCSRHGQLYEDIFCDDCEEFICLTCFVDDHKGHKIHKYEELERKYKEQLHGLNEKGKRTRTHYEEFRDFVENNRKDMHSYLSSLEQKIRDSFDEKVDELQKQKERLLKEVEDIGKKSDEQIDVCIDHQRELTENFESSVRKLTENRDNVAYSDALKALHLHCKKSDSIFKEHIYKEAVWDEKRKVESAKFFRGDKRMMNLGRVESGVKQKAEDLELGSKTARILSIHDPLNIAKTVDLPNKMCGMAALSQDEVLVGYGDKKEGVQCISVSGEKKEFLDSAVGNVWDIAIQTKGRSVLSHGKDACYAYKAKSAMREGQSAKATCKQYKCKEGGWFVMICNDQDDKIYAVNYSDEIYIFKESPVPLRSVPTGNTKPRQICVTKRGVMITSTCDTTPSTVTVFFRDGRVCGTITACDDNEYLYAAVDSEDRLLVARVRGGSEVLRLHRYSFRLRRVMFKEEEEVYSKEIFQERILPHCIESDDASYWCYMVSLTPDRLAFANRDHLYFIDLPTRSSLWDKIMPWSWWQ